MSKLSPEETAARENITRWFLYFLEVFYERRGKSGNQFAKKLGVSRSVITNLRNDGKLVSFDVALRMVSAFTRTLDELVFESPPEEMKLPIPPSRAPSKAPARQRQR